MKRSAICIVSTFLLASLLPLFSPQVSAISAFSDNGQTNDITWMHGISGTTFVGYNGSSLQLMDIENGTVYQSVSCTSLAGGSLWKGGPIKISADEQYFMCASERYRLVGLNLVSVSSGAYEYTMDVKSGFKSQWVRPDTCWNKHDGDGTLSIMNGTSYIANVTAIRDGSNGVIIESMHLYEDNPYKMLVIFAANGGGTDCDDSVNRRYLTVDFNSSTQVNFGHTRGSELSGCTKGLKVHNLGAIATHYGGSQCTSVTWFELDSANPWNDSAKKGVDSWMDSNYGGTKYHWSVSPDCWMAGIITSNSSSDLQHIMMNGTRTDVPLNQYSGKDIDAVACTSNENGTILVDGTWYTYWRDSDTDGVNDFEDAFPNDATQTEDTDGDGFGDSFSGFQADACTNQPGTSFHDRFGCPDMDNDGWSDQSDAFPNIASQWNDTDGDGYGDNSTGWKGDSCPSTYGDSNKDKNGCPDDDLDGWSNDVDVFDSDSSQWNDTDSDGWGDNGAGLDPDSCPTQWGNSSLDRYGCPDIDGDGWSDFGDDLPNEYTQWKDSDGDGFGDNPSGEDPDAFPLDGTQWIDTDGDGFGDNEGGNNGDSCPSIFGTSTIDRNGCIDTDGDGVSDLNDAFPNDPNAWLDTDGDGVEDILDIYPFDPTQWNDTDGDGFGDNPYGVKGDACNLTFGNSSIDVFGCPDSDGDGWSDGGDAFPDDENAWLDSDADGVEDEDDAYPYDPSQTLDSDNDTYGDNINGVRGDSCPTIWGNSSMDRYGCLDTDGDGWSDLNDGFPNDKSRYADTDGDGIEDKFDDFPYDPTQTTDSDGDGMGDNPMGIGADKFPNDITQWGDIDGDGYGDNQTGNNADAFPTDTTQWSDQDGDGYGDNPAGNLYDMFPLDATQWIDSDGDGLGDNQSGNNPDPYPNDRDNDGYNDSIDLFPDEPTQWADDDKDGLGDNTDGVFGDPSLGDRDNDGVLDADDAFPLDPKDWVDFDGDGVGDNSDPDDDDDGILDIVELQEGTDPFSSSSKPVEGFEVILPGTNIALGAWDLLGVFAGIPLTLWLCFAVLTRGSRTKRFQKELLNAQSSEELMEIASRYEKSMLLRSIGPHQAMRLERLRSGIESHFKEMEQAAQNPSLNSMLEVQTMSSPPPRSAQGVVNMGGYEWLDHEGAKWYRKVHSGTDWVKWQ
mgnify:CR=1 FL=1